MHSAIIITKNYIFQRFIGISTHHLLWKVFNIEDMKDVFQRPDVHEY